MIPNPSTPSDSRRQQLRALLKVLSLIAALLLVWPFIASLNHNTESETQNLAWQQAGTLDGIGPGQVKVIMLARPPGEVWVYRRTTQELALLRTPTSSPASEIASSYLVFLPYIPPRGCRLSQLPDNVGFLDRCTGTRYDTTGKAVTANEQTPVPGLVVPPHRITHMGQLEVRVWQPGMP